MGELSCALIIPIRIMVVKVDLKSNPYSYFGKKPQVKKFYLNLRALGIIIFQTDYKNLVDNYLLKSKNLSEKKQPEQKYPSFFK